MNINTDIRATSAHLAMESEELAIMAEVIFGESSGEYWALVNNWRTAMDTYHQTY